VLVFFLFHSSYATYPSREQHCPHISSVSIFVACLGLYGAAAAAAHERTGNVRPRQERISRGASRIGRRAREVDTRERKNALFHRRHLYAVRHIYYVRTGHARSVIAELLKFIILSTHSLFLSCVAPDNGPSRSCDLTLR